MGSNAKIGEFEELVLLAISSLNENAYGVTIRRLLEEVTERTVSIGSVYVALDRLEKKGLVTAWTGEPTSERGGRAKRFFQLNGAGRDVLDELSVIRQKLKTRTPLGLEA
jgi:PadR family transcriptional regulator, regulatory protein PadR